LHNYISEMDHVNGSVAGIENGSSSSHGEHAGDVEEPAAASGSRYVTLCTGIA